MQAQISDLRPTSLNQDEDTNKQTQDEKPQRKMHKGDTQAREIYMEGGPVRAGETHPQGGGQASRFVQREAPHSGTRMLQGTLKHRKERALRFG